MRIVQIVPFLRPGTGVAGVAWNLDREFRAAGIETESFTFADARRGRPLPRPRHPVGRRLARAWRVVWFSTVGTARARRFLADRPDAISICHSEALTGDIFVSHGIETAAVRARARGWWHLLANPVRAFTYLRERHRYRSPVHRVVVTLSDAERRALHSHFRRILPPVQVIPNGVDLAAFHPPAAEERSRARAAFRLDDDARVALLIGHDLIRKGILTAIDALTHAPTVLLLVVGGDSESVAAARDRASRNGVAERVLFAGTRNDIPAMMAASDMFVFPSEYEANALVVLEALASGLPVICTAVGYAPQVIVNGENGWITGRDVGEIGRRLAEVAAADETERARLSRRARESVEGYGWADIARRYLALAEDLARTAASDGRVA
jgi:glycosyltransferase involved in cell wall biosynthesis